ALPRQNEKNIKEDLSEDLRRDMTFHFVTNIEEVLLLALQPAGRPAAGVVTREMQRSLQ
ncbi:MAG: hypothetical protein IMZ55_12635, partial [Acidobacteria bacterium]|nr:hypothetical protein [Acidobacteriota bacterium]